MPQKQTFNQNNTPKIIFSIQNQSTFTKLKHYTNKICSYIQAAAAILTLINVNKALKIYQTQTPVYIVCTFQLKQQKLPAKVDAIIYKFSKRGHCSSSRPELVMTETRAKVQCRVNILTLALRYQGKQTRNAVFFYFMCVVLDWTRFFLFQAGNALCISSGLVCSWVMQ